MTDFDRAVEVIFRVEGYDKQIVDEGGLTKWGISKNANPDLDIASLTKEQAKEIYRQRYWLPVRGDELAWPLNLCVFDAAVNQGNDAAIKMLQAAVGVAADGRLGAKTLAAVKHMPAVAMAQSYMAKRALRYVGTRNFDKYGYGWFSRLFRVLSAS